MRPLPTLMQAKVGPDTVEMFLVTGVTTFTHRRTPRRLRMGPCNLGFRL